MIKKALITGITGQDGSYMAELLLEKGYEVHGIIRRSSSFNTNRVNHLMNDKNIWQKTFFLHYGDLSDSSNINYLINTIKPDEIYNFGAQSHVKVSFEVPEYTADIDALGPLRILDSIRQHNPKCKYYQASTSEMFGGQESEMPEKGFNEESMFHPRSPYGVAKLYGHWITKNYRESYGLCAISSCLFNHESPRRGDTFVTKKITNWCKEYMKDGELEPLELGNIYAYRDWGHAKDFCRAIYLMMQQDEPDDYVIATGEMYTVKDFINECFKSLDNNITWVGSGLNEVGMGDDGAVLIKINEKYFRPAEVDVLLGDSSKARENLGWKPEYDFESLVKDMLEYDE